MIQIHIEARNAKEAREQVQQLLALSSASVTATPAGGIELRAVGPTAAPTAPVTRTEAPVTPAREEVAAPTAALSEAPATESLAAAPPWEEPSAPTETNQTDAPAASAEEVRAALNGLRKARGTDALRAIFKRYGVASFPELNPSVYDTLLREVKEELNGGQ